MSNIEMETAESPRPASANGLKRKQSEEVAGEEQEHETKRQRVSPGKSTPERKVEHPGEGIEEQRTNGAEEVNVQTPNASTDAVEARGVQQEPPKTTLPDAQPAPPSTTHSTTVLTEEEEEPRQEQEQERQHQSPAARKRSIKVDERQRTKRLFGSLLGSLNQPRDRTTSKRQEIEARRKAELQRQDDERLEDRQRRLEKLEEKRRRVQWEVDEENMRIQHRNLLHRANFLLTETEPRIMYRPWELRADEEDRIDQQLDDARDRINKEVAEFEDRRRRHFDSEDMGASGVRTASSEVRDVEAKQGEIEQSVESTEPLQNGGNVEHPIEKPAECPDSSDDPRPGDNGTTVNGSKENYGNDDKAQVLGTREHLSADDHKADNDDGDHVVEGEEDTVIY